MVTGSSNRSLDFSTSGQKVGLRFSGVSIPQGAKITKAYVRLMAAESDIGTTTLSIRAHDTDSASAFSSSSRNISSRSLTSASESWSPSSWSRGSVAQSDNFAAVVQEVVSRSGWRSGNALALVVSGDNRNDRQAVSVDGGGTRVSPTLYVWYETDGDDGDDGGDDGDDGGGSSGSVSGDLGTWNSRLVATITNPKYDSYNAWMNPDRMVSKGDTFSLARNFNNYATSLVLAYRETGDRTLVRQLDRLMNIAKGKLRDSNGDGYLNWVYNTRTDSSSAPYLGTDKHVMDEMMSHSMVASVAYTLKQAGYSSSASYWTNYLKNHFEKKWRKRSGKSSGFPFMNHFLMHPTTNFIRYHYFMYKLTGDGSYYSEAKRLAGTVKGTMRSSGSGYVWDHKVGSRSGCQPMVYVKYTTQALVDLASANSGLFDSSFMRRVAYSMANKGLRSTSGSLASSICGGGSYGSVYTAAQYPYMQLAPWDSSGRLKSAAERVYAATERYNTSSPTSYTVPATMVFTLGR